MDPEITIQEDMAVEDPSTHDINEQPPMDPEVSPIIEDSSISNNIEAAQPETSTQLTVETSDVPPATPTAAAVALVPSLRGKMSYVGGIVYCKGVWAMTDASHGVPGQTSEFEFKLVAAEEGVVPGTFPINGRYNGWFALKQPPPMKGSVKIDDKDMQLVFIKDEESNDHKISGKGHNKFGSFNLHGTLTADGAVHVYREYYNLTPHPVPVTTSKRKYSFGGDAGESKKKSAGTPGGGLSIVKPKVEGVPAEAATPREGAGRVRKMSSLMREYEDSNAIRAAQVAAAAVASVTPKAVQRAVTQPLPVSVPLMRQESSSDRAQRLSAPLKKCGDILREFTKHPQGVWFLEPVDWVKFNIPDYPNIIKSPMDFRTIRTNLEAMKYDSHEAFAEHMRLVFRNAMTFNQMRDNPVHIAAREMSARFEDRYRHVISQLGVYNRDLALEVAVDSRAVGRPSLGGQKKSAPKSAASTPRAQAPPGPRPPVAYLPSVGDSSSHQIMEMQRLMQAMQGEINSLRSAVRETEIVKRLHETQDAAHNPLTFDEKKKLIAQINKLPPNKLEHVLDIIQAAIPKNADNDSGEVEVPLDALDTFTLRKLQKFIEDSAPKKKPPAGVPPLQRQSSSTSVKSAGASKEVKRPRKSAVAANGMLMADHELSLFENDEDLLFSADSFEELKQHDSFLGDPAAGSAAPAPTTSFAPPVMSFEAEVRRQSAEAQPGQDDYRRGRAGSLDEGFDDLMGDGNTSGPV